MRDFFKQVVATMKNTNFKHKKQAFAFPRGEINMLRNFFPVGTVQGIQQRVKQFY